MPTIDTPVALQLPGTLAERLTMAVGQMVAVYLMNVHAPSIIGGPCPCPPYPPAPPAPTPPAPPAVPSPGEGSAWGGPPLTPGIPPGGGHVTPIPLAWECEPGKPPTPMMGTAVVSGTLAFAGADYLVIRIPAGAACKDILVPYNAVGVIVLGSRTV